MARDDACNGEEGSTVKVIKMKGLVSALTVLLWAVGLGAGAQDPAGPQDAQDKPVTLTVSHVNIREALRRLFGAVHVKCIVDLDVQGDVTANYRDVPFETALRGLLDQVGGTYMVAAGVYGIVKRSSGEAPAPDEYNPELPEFQPGAFTDRYEVRDKRLFLSPHRTVGGTLSLLREAIDVAGFDEPEVLRYGRRGLAVVLPCEPLSPKGGPARAGVDHISPGLHYVSGDPTTPKPPVFRRLVLIVEPPVSRATGRRDADALHSDGRKDLSWTALHTHWNGDPKLTVLIYEYRWAKDDLAPVLLKKGESHIRAKAHVIASGLWTAEQLR